MLRLVQLLLYLTALFSSPPPADIGGGWDPNGRMAPPPADIGGGLDPNG